MTSLPRERYLSNLSLIEPFNHASQHGILYDQTTAAQIRSTLTPRLWEAQARVDAAAGLGVEVREGQVVPRQSTAPTPDTATSANVNLHKGQIVPRQPIPPAAVSVPCQASEDGTAAGIVVPQGDPLLAYIKANCCVKRHVTKGLVTSLETAVLYAKKDYIEPLRRVRCLVTCPPDQQSNRPLQSAAVGEIAALVDLGLNVKSTKAVTSTLNRLGLPPIFKRGKRKPSEGEGAIDDTTLPSQTKDASALLTLFLRTGHPITTALLETIALRDRLKELDRPLDPDGRMRSMTQVCGPKTNRTASHKWLTGSGGNVQTIPKEPVNFRVCYIADPGHLILKLDLTGADLWTVAARVAAEGDRTMLDDLRAGIRIPSLVGLLIEHDYKPSSDRAQVKADCQAYRASLKAKGESWKDTVWKKASHLTNYGGSPKRIRQSVIEDTYAELGRPIDPSLALCARVQSLYLTRYWGIPKWWSRIASNIVRTGRLTYATGHEREFLSRRIRNGKLDDETKREALASEPQSNTTWVIKEGVNRLWHDLENWPSGVVGEGAPIVRPLICCVHDETVTQTLLPNHPWAIAKLTQWFSVELTIGGECIVFPFEMAAGANWGECEKV